MRRRQTAPKNLALRQRALELAVQLYLGNQDDYQDVTLTSTKLLYFLEHGEPAPECVVAGKPCAAHRKRGR